MLSLGIFNEIFQFAEPGRLFAITTKILYRMLVGPGKASEI